ncbi:hypothetical protein F8M41_000114 [Gigaspora margarita]|uniref:Uncharacterized protein n=1 Tax=Gigaspora margarita TaxID=4874 RepID=A0A8H4B511_GIGMA|nr:hypothetical protein F8M41_000114 [Gigaspora margarita]
MAINTKVVKNLKSIPRIISKDNVNLEKDTQSTKELEGNTPIEEGYQKFIKRENRIIINNIGNNIAIYHLRNANFGIEVKLKAYEMFDSLQKLDTNKLVTDRWYPQYEITTKRNKSYNLIVQGSYCQEEISLEKAYKN